MKKIKPLPSKLTDQFKSKVGTPSGFELPKEIKDEFRSDIKRILPRGTVEETIGDLEEYRKEACKAVGVVYEKKEKKIYHHVGEFEITSSVEAVDALVQVYLSVRKPSHIIFGYEEYLDACKRKGQIQGRLDAIDKHQEQEHERWNKHQDQYSKWASSESSGPSPSFYEKPEPLAPPDSDLAFLYAYNLRTFKPNLQGFLAYIGAVAPDFHEILLKPVPLLLEENSNRPHGYVLGGSGSGKSELLKLLIHTYVTNENYGAIVAIDPTSDFVTQIAKWKEFNKRRKRLIYIRPTLAKGMTPVINPFEIYGVDATDYSEEALNVKRVIAQELVEALGRIVSETGSKLSGPMATILTNCVLVLLDKNNATLKDLANFMKKDMCEELVEFASGLSHHEYIAEYFRSSESGFGSKVNQMTKDAVARRLDDLLSVGTFKNLTCGKSTFHIEEAVNKKKVILFDLSKGAIGGREGSAFGRLIIAMLLGMAYRRENQTVRVPCSLIVDECHNFVSESMSDILSEARKYKLFATLAQQTAGQRMPLELRDAVLQNTNMQVVGGTTPAGAKRNADLVGITASDIEQLEIGEFYTKPKRSLPAVKFKTRTDLLNWKNCVTTPTWKTMVYEQITKYYQHHDGSKEVILEEEPDITPHKW